MKKIYLTALLVVLTFLSFAQKATKDSVKKITRDLTSNTVQKLLPQITPKSPNVAGLERHGEYPVSMYSGLVSIDIPLYEIKVGNIVIPVKLSYHASGNKVNDNASWVGLGWSLMGDYTLSRNVRGKADESDFGNTNSLLQNNLPSLQQFTSCLTTQLASDFNQYINFGKDAERDIFTYHTPNKTNSFVLTPNQGTIWQEPDKSIFSDTGALQNPTILDENGTKYVYGNPELTVSSLTGAGAFSAWHLTEIEGIKLSDKIKFTYESNPVFSFTGEITDSEVYHTDIYGASAASISGGFQGNFTSTDSPGVSSELLKEIIFPMGKVVFVPSANNRLDNLGKSLESVEIYGYNVSSDSYTLIKKYTLTYVYKQRSGATTGDLVMFLDKVNLVSNDNTVLGSYSLAYNNNQSLPAATSRAKDFWGYANGQTFNRTLVPLLPFTVPVFIPAQQTFNVGGANRDVNIFNSQAWILQRINFPTGGSTDFTYENNQYQDNTGRHLAGGLRIKQIVSNDNAGKTTTKIYKYGLGESGNGTIRSLAYQNYSTVQKIKHPSLFPGDPDYFYTIRTFSSALTHAINTNEGSPVTYPVVTEYEDDGSGANGVPSNGKTVYTFKDDASDDLITIPSNGKSAQRNRSWNRGQLLSKVIYGADGKKKYEQINTYSTIETGLSPTIGYLIGQSELALTGSYIDLRGCFQNGDKYDPVLPITWNYGLVKQTASMENFYDHVDVAKFTTKKSETTYSPIHFQPTEMKEYVANNVVLGKLIWYPQDFATIPATAAATGEVNALRSLQKRNILSTAVEEIDYRKDLSTANAYMQITGGKFLTFETIASAGIEKAIVPKTVSLTECLWNTFLNPDYSINFTPASGLFDPNTHTSTLPRNVNHKTRIYFDTYDAEGNLTTFHPSNGASTKYNYATATTSGLSFVYPISEIQNYVSPNPLGLKALTTHFSFTIPLLGMDAMTDQTGLKTYFEYDNFGRLFQLKDHNGKIVKKYQYQY